MLEQSSSNVTARRSLNKNPMSQLEIFNQQPPKHKSLENFIITMMTMSDDPLADAGTNVVICRGNPRAKLMIIGEAPGPQENIQGKPFVGRAGQLLDKILTAANFDFEQDVFITNSVFRMPPGEGGKAFRKPKTDEIEYYRWHVKEIIRLADPRIILFNWMGVGLCLSSTHHICSAIHHVLLIRQKPSCGMIFVKFVENTISLSQTKHNRFIKQYSPFSPVFSSSPLPR
jgi:uracil-DNA glycosylase family 4